MPVYPISNRIGFHYVNRANGAVLGNNLIMRLALSVFLIFPASSAIAEVCDKVRPDWNPSTGSISQVQELYFFFSNPLGIILIALCILAFIIRHTIVSSLVALVLVAVASLIAVNWLWPVDGVTQEAFREGCTANPLFTSIVVVALAAMVGILGKNRKS